LLITESAVLAIFGGAVGIALAGVTVRLLRSNAPARACRVSPKRQSTGASSSSRSSLPASLRSSPASAVGTRDASRAGRRAARRRTRCHEWTREVAVAPGTRRHGDRACRRPRGRCWAHDPYRAQPVDDRSRISRGRRADDADLDAVACGIQMHRAS
jgi:hypothetical protein